MTLGTFILALFILSWVSWLVHCAITYYRSRKSSWVNFELHHFLSLSVTFGAVFGYMIAYLLRKINWDYVLF